MLPHEKYSANELEKVVQGKLTSETTDRLSKLLVRLERSVYGGATDSDMRGLLDEARAVIDSIERNS